LEKEQEKLHDEYQKNLRRRDEKEKTTEKKIRGRKPHPVLKKPDEKLKGNMTDPDSRIMKTRKGFIQGYNDQAIVDADSQIIVAGDLAQDENDKHQQIHMVEKLIQYLDRIPGKLTMDAGYWD